MGEAVFAEPLVSDMRAFTTFSLAWKLAGDETRTTPIQRHSMYLGWSFSRIACFRSERNVTIIGGREVAAVEFHRMALTPTRETRRAVLNIFKERTKIKIQYTVSAKRGWCTEGLPGKTIVNCYGRRDLLEKLRRRGPCAESFLAGRRLSLPCRSICSFLCYSSSSKPPSEWERESAHHL